MALPSAIKSMLNEHCGGGYILIRIDENNEFDIDQHYDSPVQSRALLSWASKVLKNIERASDLDMEMAFNSAMFPDMDSFLDDEDDYGNEEENGE